jgi:hypothetical protein
MFLVIDRVYKIIFSIIHIFWKVLQGWKMYAELKLCKSEHFSSVDFFLILTTFKGLNRAHYHIHKNSADTVDEIEDYWNAHYLSTGEAIWQILGYNLTKTKTAVMPINIHLPTNESNC